MTDSDNTPAVTWQPGPLNLITDVPGVRVGHADDSRLNSGTTVLTADAPFCASVDIMGGAPGTRDTELLSPERSIEAIDALVLSGGSAFGLAAATGVSEALRRQSRGFKVGPATVPIVPTAILFDLLNGGQKHWEVNPYPALGESALDAAQNMDESGHFDIGSVGAGMGATTATLKGGLGSASLVLPGGIRIGALVAVNPHGSVSIPGSSSGHFWAAPFEFHNEFGGLGAYTAHDPSHIPVNHKLAAFDAQAQSNTTIAIVATDAALGKAALKRLAVAAQDGIARAIVPAHTAYDGDLVFAASTGERVVEDANVFLQLGHAASVCLSRAIARGVYEASAASHDILPSWQQRYGSEAQRES